MKKEMSAEELKRFGFIYFEDGLWKRDVLLWRPYFRSVRSVAIPSPNLLSTYCRRKLDNNVIIKISEVYQVSCAIPSLPAFQLKRETKIQI